MNDNIPIKCPFLKDTTVRYCEVSPIRKLVPIDAICEEDQRCLSNKYTSCDAAREHLNGLQELDRCPFLHTAVMSSCSAAPGAKPVPKNNSVTSKCNSSAFLYCDTYLRMSAGAAGGQKKDVDQPIIEGIKVPMHLAYSTNHMWLDTGEDGVIHVGVDAFLARVLGEVEQVQFNFGKNGKKPAVLLRTQGMDLYLVFPGHLEVTGTNRSLLKTPRKLLDDPYSGGWLFESIPPSGFPSHPTPVSGLIGGKMAVDWMRSEIERMNGFIHDLPSRQCQEGERLAADGGTFQEGFARYLDHRDLYYMHNMFFTANESHR